MRQLSIAEEAIQTLGPEGALLTDTRGTRWRIVADKDHAMLVLTEQSMWTIHIEGYLVGSASHEDPGEAVREVFKAAGLESLPEAVEVRAASDKETWVIFTLNSVAYKVPTPQFASEVLPSTRWVQARGAKRAEIDALMAELKVLKP